ncbi:Rv0361 family membrane protein [Cellulomonas fengjieae]|uniref:DUF4878 domain-containing protein n=1 Tax=Cellulomonas fengjieae TaxID=2819978 RepID=A0ABS3SBA9_9CELL|nr:hypothetical protein [Cellulomonas fengjieae]MBO3083037.1 hypothetical protein [Cellulomonas fengjieae]QVI65592.1 hypothetical protein KG102_16085 [Cellulomonas fengjieae]
MSPPPDPPRRRRWPWVVAAAAVVLVVAAAVVLPGILRRAFGDEAQIRAVVEDFARAVDREDQAAVIALLCDEEASAITEDDDYDPANDGGVADPPSPRPVRTSEIRVTGGVASARVARSGQPTITLWFRQEDDRWTVCAPAEQ